MQDITTEEMPPVELLVDERARDLVSLDENGKWVRDKHGNPVPVWEAAADQ